MHQPLHRASHHTTHRHPFHTILYACSGFIVAVLVFSLWIGVLFAQTAYILPGITIDGVAVGGKTLEEAQQLLEAREETIAEQDMLFTFQDVQHATSSAFLGVRHDYRGPLAQAFAVGRDPSPLTSVLDMLRTFRHPKNLVSSLSFSNDRVSIWVAALAEQIDIEGARPAASLRISGNAESLAVSAGKDGRRVDQEQLINTLMETHSTIPANIEVPVKLFPALTSDGIVESTTRTKRIVGKSISVKIDTNSFLLSDKTLVSLLAFPQDYNDALLDKEVASWKERVTRQAKEPKLVIENGKVRAFTPPVYGRSIDAQKTRAALTEELKTMESPLGGEEKQRTLEIPVVKTLPEGSLESTNTYGIRELIGSAESFFAHSIPNRVHNVALTASRINWALIPPGTTFSFNQTVGEVSRSTGYKPAYVIQQGRTVLGDGGGVCQVSTTVFRAALNTGLPILERKGHSYRVGYYEQNAPPGLDATVYAPSADLKFSNDTSAYILIETITDTKDLHLTVNMYGTSDGRKAEILEQKLWDQTPPRATVYQDDPTLPPGVLRQVDWSAPGAKASFRYMVKRGEEVLQDRVFKTIYQPWAAVYLRGI